MSRGSAFSFICECLATIPGGHLIAEPASNVDWTGVVALAHEYRVSPTLAAVLGSSSILPTTLGGLFTSLAAHARQRNEKILKQAIEVAQVLNGIGVDPLFMKGGAHLFTGLYPDMAMRHMSDLDILVPAARIEECVAGLAAAGVAPLTDYLHPRAHHLPPLGREDMPVPIELHHHVIAHPHSNFLTPEQVIASSVQIESHGVRVTVPSPTNAAILNIAHAQLNDHDCLYGRIDLRGLLDLALLSHLHASSIDWDAIRPRFVKAGRRHAFEFHIEWARKLKAHVPSHIRTSNLSRVLCRRASYHVRHPQSLSLSVRLLRPLVLLRRELSEAGLRRRLAANVFKYSWWQRHLRMLADG